MKTLKDFIMNVNFEQVAEVLKREYPKDWKGAGNGEGFEMVFNNLKEMEPVSRDDGIKIVIEHVKQEWDDPEIPDEEYEDVGGIDDDGERWALDFTPWVKWLGMEIHPESVHSYSPAEIVAHCIWEMTWNGFTEEEIEKKKNEFGERLAKAFEEEFGKE